MKKKSNKKKKASWTNPAAWAGFAAGVNMVKKQPAIKQPKSK